jgi:hypothetical protein
MSRPSRKKSRFSGKEISKRVRFTCCSSASTWAKSVLTVKSANRLSLTPSFTSSPASACVSLETTGFASRSVSTLEIPYGLTSSVRPTAGASSPTRTPQRETRITALAPFDPPPVTERGTLVRYDHSLR